MKRQLILGLVLVLLVIVAFGTYFFVDHYQESQQKKASEEAEKLQLSSLNSDNVTKLDLHTPDLDYTVEQNDDGEWEVTSGDDMHINTYYITALCTYGASLSASEDVGKADSAKMDSYGLSDPISITYYAGNEKETIYVGNQSPTKEYFYMMREGSDDVFLVDADTAGYLYVTETQLRYRYVMEDTSSAIEHISLKKGDDVVYDLAEVSENADWRMSAPYAVPLDVDNSKLTELFALIRELEIDDFGESGITEADYAEYGFDKPGYTFQFTQENGTETTLLFEDYDPTVTSYINCLHVETGEVLVFDSSYVSFLQEDTTDYLLETLYKPGINDVASLQVTYEGSYNDKTLDFDFTMDLDTTNEQYTCDGTAVTATDSERVAAIKEFFNTVVNMKYESIDMTGTLPENAEVALQLKYTMNDGTSHVVELIRNDDKTYWARIDGEFTYALVRQRELSGENNLLERYTDLMTLMGSVEK